MNTKTPEQPEKVVQPKHYVLEVQSATIRGTAKIEAPEEAEEKDDGESSS